MRVELALVVQRPEIEKSWSAKNTTMAAHKEMLAKRRRRLEVGETGDQASIHKLPAKSRSGKRRGSCSSCHSWSGPPVGWSAWRVREKGTWTGRRGPLQSAGPQC